MNPFRFISSLVNNSMQSSNDIAKIDPIMQCNAFGVNRPGPLPQSSYIFETICTNSITGTSALIITKAQNKYLRKSMFPADVY